MPPRNDHFRALFGRLTKGCALAAIALLGLLAMNAHAALSCTGPVQASVTVTLPNTTYAVPRDTAVGTLIGPWQAFQRSPTNEWTCSGDAGISYGPAYQGTLTPSGQTYTDPASGQVFPVYTTNVDGVGLVIGVSSYNTSTDWADIGYGGKYPHGLPLSTSLTSAGTVGIVGGSLDNHIFGVAAAIGFVKTGPISGGVVTGMGTFATVGMAPRPIVAGILPANMVLAGATTFTVLACTTPDVSVNLGTHSADELPTVGATTAATGFQIALTNCPTGMNSVSYRIDPMTSVLDATQSVVALDSTSTATGVGVQLLQADGATPLPLSTTTLFNGYSAATGGSYAIPLQVRYVRNGDLTTGQANTAMTFTMTYL